MDQSQSSWVRYTRFQRNQFHLQNLLHLGNDLLLALRLVPKTAFLQSTSIDFRCICLVLSPVERRFYCWKGLFLGECFEMFENCLNWSVLRIFSYSDQSRGRANKDCFWFFMTLFLEGTLNLHLFGRNIYFLSIYLFLIFLSCVVLIVSTILPIIFFYFALLLFSNQIFIDIRFLRLFRNIFLGLLHWLFSRNIIFRRFQPRNIFDLYFSIIIFQLNFDVIQIWDFFIHLLFELINSWSLNHQTLNCRVVDRLIIILNFPFLLILLDFLLLHEGFIF